MTSSSPLINVKNANLLIIDPQVDFHEGGKLGVSGANADSEKISKFVEKHVKELSKIYVSLDTHTENHIGHSGYWESVDESRSKPPEWTNFSFIDGKIMGKRKDDFKYTEYTPKKEELQEWTEKYVRTIEGYGKGVALIWPNHCLEGDKGHAVAPQLKQILEKDYVKNKVEYHIKGQNEATEMYSIFQAEIPVKEDINNDNKTIYYNGMYTDLKSNSQIETNTDKEDGAYLNTKFNGELYTKLTGQGAKIIICGEALSHCVNWSLRDLVNKLISDKNPNYVQKDKYGEYDKLLKSYSVILLLNASSPVKDYEKNVESLLEFCKNTNVSICYLSDDNDVTKQKPDRFRIKYNYSNAWKVIQPNMKFKGGKTKKRRNNKNNRKSRKHRRSRKHH
jgi:nicotinamidase-related amidase